MEFIIADDHVLFREMLAEYLERYLPKAKKHFVGDYFSVEKILLSGVNADLVILDYNMSGMDGANTIKEFKQKFTDTPVAVMSGVARAKHIRQSMDNGAVGYFPKTLSGTDFVKGIEDILAGHVFVPVSAQSGNVFPTYYADVGIPAHDTGERSVVSLKSRFIKTGKANFGFSHAGEGK